MHKNGSDAKVKKSLVRNFEQKAITTAAARRKAAVLDMGCPSNATDRTSRSSQKENELNLPTICSSEALANYLTDIKKSVPLQTPLDEVDKYELGTKVTKKLNFHFNDRIYKNLIELNANINELKTKRDKRHVSSAGSAKRDVEPNIEDFCQDERDDDIIPIIPVVKPKFKAIQKVESGRLHQLLASFEDL